MFIFYVMVVVKVRFNNSNIGYFRISGSAKSATPSKNFCTKSSTVS